jgi:hypothetical protein
MDAAFEQREMRPCNFPCERSECVDVIVMLPNVITLLIKQLMPPFVNHLG